MLGEHRGCREGELPAFSGRKKVGFIYRNPKYCRKRTYLQENSPGLWLDAWSCCCVREQLCCRGRPWPLALPPVPGDPGTATLTPAPAGKTRGTGISLLRPALASASTRSPLLEGAGRAAVGSPIMGTWG